MLSNQRETVKPIVYAIAKNLTWIHPHILTIIGLSISVIIFFLLTNEYYLYALLVGFLLPFDALDGAVATLTKKTSKFGTFLDSTTDRFADFFLILGFGTSNLVNWPLTLSVILTSFMISYMRAMIESVRNERIKLAKGLMQRTERIALLGLSLAFIVILTANPIGAFNLAEYVFMLILIGNIYTIYQRLMEAYKILK